MSTSKNTASANKALKQNLANVKNPPKNDVFYVKKRGLFRKAEQVTRYCNSDVFIIVHNKDSDKIFHYMSEKAFNLEKIANLIHRDVIQGAALHKNRKFEDVDFEKVKRNINEIGKINALYGPNETRPAELMQQKNEESLMKGLPASALEDSESMSVQGPATRGTKSRGGNAAQNEGTFNAMSSQDPMSPATDRGHVVQRTLRTLRKENAASSQPETYPPASVQYKQGDYPQAYPSVQLQK